MQLALVNSWREVGLIYRKATLYSCLTHLRKPAFKKLSSQQSNQVLRKSSQTQQEDVQLALDMSEASGDDSDDSKECHDKLFSCPEEVSIKSFQRFSSLQHHLDVGKYKYALKNETLFYTAMIFNATKLEQGIASVDNPVEDSETLQALDSSPLLPMGWALKSARTKRTRLTNSQKE